MMGLASVVADGVAYGMLLLLFSVGLSVTLGLMRFINLAHGAFAMCGGYVATTLLQTGQLPFLLVPPQSKPTISTSASATSRRCLTCRWRLPPGPGTR